MATLVIDRTTPMDTLFSFIGADCLRVTKRLDGVAFAPVVDPDDIDPDSYPDTTAYLNAIPGMADSLIESMSASASEFKPVPRKFFNCV